jgi:hypothetical protein
VAHGLTRDSLTASVDLAETLAQLAQCDLVDALAVYGPPAHVVAPEQAADYDVLVLARERPKSLLHVWTTIGRRSADVLLMDTRTYDDVLGGRRRLATSSMDAVFMVKLCRAEIRLDRSGRFARGQLAIAEGREWLRPMSYAARYVVWFSQNFGLAHLERLATSTDPIYLITADVLLASSASATVRAYFELRELPWQGDKAAMKHLAAQDPEFLDLLRRLLTAPERHQKVERYRALVTRALEPFGEIWRHGTTAVSLDAPVHDSLQVAEALDSWEDLCAAEGARVGARGITL